MIDHYLLMLSSIRTVDPYSCAGIGNNVQQCAVLTDDGLCERSLSVVISRVLGDVTGKLCHFDLLLQVSLETREEDFPLRRLQSVHKVGQRALIVCEVSTARGGEEDRDQWGLIPGDVISNCTASQTRQ